MGNPSSRRRKGHNVMKTMCRLWIVGLLGALLLTGCHAGSTASDAQPDYSALIVPPVDLAITDCITEQQLTTVLGYPMHLLGTFEEGTQAVYLSEDSACQVTIHMINQTRAGFDAMVANAIVPMILQDGLGEAAYWYEGKTQLMAYCDDYAVDVAVTCADTDQIETYTRQIAELILTKLQQQ